LFLAPGTFASAQNASPNVVASVTAPQAVTCSAAFNSNIALTGFDVSDPGVADIMLVLDESGSISSADFAREKQFAVSLINALMTTPTGARVGIVQFSGDARLSMPITAIKTTALNLATNMYQRGGSTCIGCGMQTGQQNLSQNPRPQATKFMIVLTDGMNTVGNSTFASVLNAVKSAGTKVLAVGVGSAVSATEINQIASAIPGVQTAFLTPDFASLPDILAALTAAIVSPGATDITVDVAVEPRFPALTATASAGTAQVLGSHVLWTLPSLGATTESLQLNHQHDGAGQGPLQIFTATYSDEQGHVVEIATPSTNVTGCNTAPIANAGVDQTVSLVGGPTAAVTLNGGGSTDDGLIQPLTYAWTSGAITASGVAPTVTLPNGTHEFTLTVSDGELSDSDTVTITVGDPTAPVITHNVTGTTGSNGWYTSDVGVSFTTEDPETGVASSTGCAAASITADTAGQPVACSATNGAGATSTDTVTIKRDATAPTLTVAGPITAEATSGAGALVTYAAPGAADATSGLAGSASCAPASGSLFAIGTTTVVCGAVDNAGNAASASFTVTVRDTAPPVIGGVSASTSSLWPANHKMSAVTIAASATDSVSAAVCSITSAVSSEPDNGLGDGDTANDVIITGPLSVNLRAERSGNGPGRTYTITVTCTDAAGNSAVSATTVAVPKSNGR
jgi:uncharacterized protein YegL